LWASAHVLVGGMLCVREGRVPVVTEPGAMMVESMLKRGTSAA
jgi:hypothetical protein